MMMADFSAFRCLGSPITFATWCKGAVAPYCREMGQDWLRGFVLAESRS
jgi:hypothetical protein